MSQGPSYFQNQHFMRACLDERVDDIKKMANNVSSSDLQWGVFLSMQSGKMASLVVLEEFFDFDSHDNLMLYHACDLPEEIFEFIYARSTPSLALGNFARKDALPGKMHRAKERLLARIKIDEERDILSEETKSGASLHKGKSKL